MSAKIFGITATVVVPEDSNPAKIQLIKDAGAEIIQSGKTFDESAQKVAEISATRGYYYVHPANESHLINGVGTEFLEVIEELPDIDAIVLPLGGGSEVAAATVTLKALKPQIDIVAVQAESSCAAFKSWQSQVICESANSTFAGGFATGTAYPTTFEIYKRALSDFVLLSEHEIRQGIALAAHHTHNFVEGAGASTIMAAWKLKSKLKDKNIVLQFSGANASPEEIRTAYNLPCFVDGTI